MLYKINNLTFEMLSGKIIRKEAIKKVPNSLESNKEKRTANKIVTEHFPIPLAFSFLLILTAVTLSEDINFRQTSTKTLVIITM